MSKKISQTNQFSQDSGPTETMPVTPESPSKKPKPGLIIGLIIFALIALGAAGVFAYKYFQAKKTSLPEKPTPTIYPALKPTETPSPEWLTYTNENLCYTFSYPQEVSFQERPEEKIFHLSLWGPSQKQETEFYDGISLSFSYPLSIGETSLKDYVDGQIEDAKQFGEIVKPLEPVVINGINGYSYTLQGLGTFKNIYLQSSDKTCTVQITDATSDPTNQGYSGTVNKILSSFKIK
jgi:hypothetical protein